MARILGGCLVLAAMLSACGGSGSTASATADLQKQADLYNIDQIEVTFHKAASTHDVDMMMSLFADDAVPPSVARRTRARTRSETCLRRRSRRSSRRIIGCRILPLTSSSPRSPEMSGRSTSSAITSTSRTRWWW